MLPYYSFSYLCIKIRPIATDKLNIDKVKDHFKDNPVFETRDIFAFYKEEDKSVKQTTINWRVYTLIQMGILQRIGRGKFALGEGRNYIPEISPKMKSVFTKIKREYPYLNVCIWHTSLLNEFMLHQPSRFYYLVEVDKEATNSVFYFLRESKIAAFLEPTKEILEQYTPNEKDVFIVKSLVSEAPLVNVKGVNTASIEKMLVDIFCDEVTFSAQQGSEMRTIFNEAFGKYTINHSKMLRYADRRRKKEVFNKFTNSITNLRQQ